MASTLSRRRIQFRLRTLLIIVALLALPCAYVAHEAQIVAHRRSVMENAFRNGATPFVPMFTSDFETIPSVPWIRRILGDEGMKEIWWNDATKEEREGFQSAFPEAEFHDGK